MEGQHVAGRGVFGEAPLTDGVCHLRSEWLILSVSQFPLHRAGGDLFAASVVEVNE